MLLKFLGLSESTKVGVFSRSYSQSGEDMIINYLFNSKGISNPSYLDIGTNHPFLNSNTFLFYTNGSRGVCVEADVTLIDEIIKWRPNDVILNVGVSVSEKNEEDFYIFNEPGLNTFDKQEADERVSLGTYHIEKIIKVPVHDIKRLIDQQFDTFPDLISIDIEGLDLEVLKTVDWKKYRIPVVCAETCLYSENHIKRKDQSIMQYMDSVGYFPYADTYINTIYVRKEWFEAVN